ncbi:MAG: hypothetical protein CL677_02855 [Bdellovibrionaceae bacterium]|nr:hypothetical protein [Pseudobdellovibrionaceae bacterium]|tara:strand:- start:47244 stop:47876 length:633 start_codon:yes stop_codon:yes gene_type:complete
MIEKTIKTIENGVAQFEELYEKHHFMEDKDAYAAWCAQTYYYTLHTCRLLEMAGNNVENPKLKETFLAHVEEEKGHEYLAKKDYREMTENKKVEDFPEFPETHHFWSYIESETDKNPLAIFGYAIALENLAAKSAKAPLEALVKLNWPIAFIKEHYEVDQEHTEIIIELAKTLTDSEREYVNGIVETVFENYFSICHACISYSSSQKAVA